MAKMTDMMAKWKKVQGGLEVARYWLALCRSAMKHFDAFLADVSEMKRPEEITDDAGESPKADNPE